MANAIKTRTRVKYVDDPDWPGWSIGLTYAIPTIMENGEKKSLPKVDVTYPAAGPQCFTAETVERFEAYGIDVEKLAERLDFALRNEAQSKAGNEAKIPYQPVGKAAIKDRFVEMGKAAMVNGEIEQGSLFLDIARETDITALTKYWAEHVKKA